MVELARRPAEAVAQPPEEAPSGPAPLRPLRARSRKGQRSPWWTVAVVVVVLLVAAAITWEVTQSGGPQYRLVSVTTGSVSQTLDEVGTVTPSNQANLDFGTSGTVQSVGVSVGQTVTAGQKLATLDATPLWAALASAQATATSAAAKLTADENSQTGSGTSTTASTSGSGDGASATDSSETVESTSDTDAASVAGSGAQDVLVAPARITEAAFPGGGGGTAGSSSSGSAKVQQAQAQLLAAQQKADADQKQTAADLTTAIAACESTTSSGSSVSSDTETDATSTPATTPDSNPGGSGSGGSGSGGSGGPGSGGPAGSTGSSGSGSGGSGSNTACTQALAQLQKDEATVTADLQAVSAAESALSTALSQQAAAATSTTTPTTKPTTSGPSHASPSAGSTAVVASPQQLAADQVAVDAANVAVMYAGQDLLDANLVSPISGTVASISVQPGSTVSPANGTPSASDAAIVVLGPGSFVVSTSVDVSDAPSVTVGQAAVVTPDSTNEPLQGKVTSIGLVGTSSDGSTSYPVTIALDTTTGLQLTSGADAEVAFVTKHVTNVTTVPSSAVRTIGTIHLVTRYENGKASTVRVTVGVVGDLLTQIQSGVTPGQKIVLADLNEPLPGSNTSSTGTTERTFGGGGGFGGGGFGGGGFGGGGFGGGGFGGGGAVRVGG